MDPNHSMAFNSHSSASRLHNLEEAWTANVPNNPKPVYEMNDMMGQEVIDPFMWKKTLEIIHSKGITKHNLPLTRMKRAMKSNTDVKLVSASASSLLARTTELFIEHLTIRSWMHAEQGDRNILRQEDIANAIRATKAYEFLHDIVPKEEEEEEEDESAGENEGQAMPSTGIDNPAHLVYQPRNALDQRVTDNIAHQRGPLLTNELNFPGHLQIPQFPLNYNPAEQVSDGNGGWNAPLFLNGQNFSVPMPNQYPQNANGMYLPTLNVDRCHFNYNPVIDEDTSGIPLHEMQTARPAVSGDMVRHSGAEIPSQRLKRGYLDMLTGDTFCHDYDDMFGCPGANIESQDQSSDHHGMLGTNSFHQNKNVGDDIANARK